MKKLSLSTLFIILTVFVFGQSKKDLAAKEAIEKLIHTEVTTFLEKDWTGFEECWLQEPYTRHFVTSKAAFNGKIGWENMKSLILQGFTAEGPRGFSGIKSDIDIQVFGDAAYATFKEIYKYSTGDAPQEIEALNNAFFVKREGKWKFVCMNIVNTSSFSDANYNRELIREFLEAISGNAKTRALFSKYLSNEALIKQNLAVEQAFPMYELAADEILVEGNRVVVTANFRGIQHGQYGDISPTGNEVRFPVVLMYTIENGKISDHSVTYDNASMLRQLGALE